MKLSVKISVILFLCIVIIYAILNLYTYKFVREKLEDSLIREMKLSGSLFSSEVKNREKAVEEIIQSSALTVQMIGKQNQISQFLINEIKNNSEDIYGICLASNPNLENKAVYFYNKDHKIQIKNLADSVYNYKNQDWFKNPFSSKTDGWSMPYFDKNGGEILMSTYSYPIINSENEIEWIITGDVSLENISEQLNLFHKDQYPRFIFISDDNGKVLTQPSGWYNRFAIERLLENKQDVLKDGQNTEYHIYINSNEHYFVLSSHIPEYKWNVNIVFDYRIVEDEIKRMSRFNIIVFCVGMLLMLICISVISNVFVKPVQKLSSIINQTGDHGLDIEIPFTERKGEVGNLARSFSEMQTRIKAFIENIKKEEAYKQRIASELSIARNIQQSLLPDMNRVKQNFATISFETCLEPAKEVGGDLYDCFKTDDSKLFLFMGDVSGKGVPAAIYMNGIRAFIRGLLNDSKENLGSIINKLNNELCCKNDLCMFTTFFCAILNPADGTLEFVNAGHPVPYLMKENSTGELKQNSFSPALGIMENYEYPVQKTQIAPSEILFLYTDGITDATNSNGEFFGNERLKEILSRSHDSVKTIKENVIAGLEHFTENTEQYDDITLFILKINNF